MATDDQELIRQLKEKLGYYSQLGSDEEQNKAERAWCSRARGAVLRADSDSVDDDWRVRVRTLLDEANKFG